MRTPRGGLLPALFVMVVLLAGLLLCGTARAATRPTLHVGQADVRVCAVKWMISGPRSHRPNVFTVHGTYSRPLHPNCNYAGRAWGNAVVAYKFRIGYPAKLLKPIAGPYFFALLRGMKHRPLLWVALAQRRAKAILAGPTKLAIKIRTNEVAELGVSEQPPGSNRGPLIDVWQRHFGLLGVEWCALFQAYFWEKSLAPEFAPPPFNRFYVPSIGEWAQQHGYLTARARVGELVAFLSGPNVLDGYHIGYVVKVTASGYSTVEGNAGDAVREIFHPFGDALRVFIAVPGVA